MSWIETYTGRRFWPLAPDSTEIDIRDIAHSLSLLCRFNGHCREFYSVAEHSCRVSAIVPREHALWGLLHDAAEAYISDLPRPLKEQMPAFNRYEDRLLAVIMERFGLDMPMPPEVKRADDILLSTELRDLMQPMKNTAPPPLEPLAERITPIPPRHAEDLFLERFRYLTDSAI